MRNSTRRSVADAQQYVALVPGSRLSGSIRVESDKNGPDVLDLIRELRDDLREVSDAVERMKADVLVVRRDLGRVAGFMADGGGFGGVQGSVTHDHSCLWSLPDAAGDSGLAGFPDVHRYSWLDEEPVDASFTARLDPLGLATVGRVLNAISNGDEFLVVFDQDLVRTVEQLAHDSSSSVGAFGPESRDASKLTVEDASDTSDSSSGVSGAPSGGAA